ncbi:MAG: lipoyl(octanoyl) transferase LipB [Bacteroidetes bacterium]|nr:lipoyl(octanoyl) transferase LipB [Bacteroidota bacterium]MDA0889247.1 lipoyl(octanoyl) transferase LipB [Bacteroidota bacterium]MDA1085089.1 lipoyl(octanoyl) transferase LipB [Bacteroidota bacterium]
MNPNPVVQVRKLGLAAYDAVTELQQELFQRTIDQKIHNRRNPDTQITTENHLLFVEHPHVYTLGKSGDENNLLINAETLAEKGVSFYPTNRGGDITYHGPGQLVGYPILDLDCFFTDIHKYLRLLEECVIDTLADFDISASRSKGETGVWIDVESDNPRKICAMGIRTSRWVTMHGFALNVNTDLSFFDYIIPCGIRNKGVTSMQKELGINIDLQEVSVLFQKHFAHHFEADVR